MSWKCDAIFALLAVEMLKVFASFNPDQCVQTDLER